MNKYFPAGIQIPYIFVKERDRRERRRGGSGEGVGKDARRGRGKYRGILLVESIEGFLERTTAVGLA